MKESNKLGLSGIFVKGYVWGLFPVKHYLERDEVVMDSWFYKYFKWIFDFVSMLFSAMLEFQNKEQVFIIKYPKKSIHTMNAFQFVKDNKEVIEKFKKDIRKKYGKTKHKKSFKKESK